MMEIGYTVNKLPESECNSDHKSLIFKSKINLKVYRRNVNRNKLLSIVNKNTFFKQVKDKIKPDKNKEATSPEEL